MEPIEGSETSAIINQTPGNYPKGNLLYSVQGESLKSRKRITYCISDEFWCLYWERDAQEEWRAM